MKAIIGGTGLERLAGFRCKETVVHTSYGSASVCVSDDGRLAFVSRHGADHALPPHMVNYRANIAALRSLGVDGLVGVYAVGSITDFLKPGEVAVVGDFLDFASSSRSSTLYDGGEAGVRHVPMDHPFDEALRASLLASDPSLKDGGVYVTTAGPRLETKAEIRALRALGADYVGMTLGTEVVLSNEAGIPMAAVAYSINWAAGVDKDGMSFLTDDEASSLAGSIASLVEKIFFGGGVS